MAVRHYDLPLVFDGSPPISACITSITLNSRIPYYRLGEKSCAIIRRLSGVGGLPFGKACVASLRLVG